MRSDTPRIVKFLVEFMSINFKVAIPTAATIPNRTVRHPPTIGSGVRVKTAPNFPITPQTIRIRPAVWKTRRLATYLIKNMVLVLVLLNTIYCYIVSKYTQSKSAKQYQSTFTFKWQHQTVLIMINLWGCVYASALVSNDALSHLMSKPAMPVYPEKTQIILVNHPVSSDVCYLPENIVCPYLS